MIYRLTIGERSYQVDENHRHDERHLELVGGIAEPSGFYFQLPTYSNILVLNRQIRMEALPTAFRSLSLAAMDIDELVRFLIVIGDIGRSNIESLSCYWESKSEMEIRWATDSNSSDPTLALPNLHVTKVGHLLRQCQRLRYLQLYLEEDSIRHMNLESFKTDSGVKELCTARKIERVEIFDFDHQRYEGNELTQWLKENIQKSITQSSAITE